MYASHFGLKQAPFSIAPDPHYLYMSERHREALAHLLYGLDGGGGFVLLTGEIGAGKTTVCRCFLEQIPAHCNVAYIFNPKLTVAELLRSVCVEFHVPLPEGAHTVKSFVDPLNQFLLANHAAGRNSVLIIDEAQNLQAEVLEQLRLLTNLETTERKLLQIVLIGQPELRQMLARPELEQLAQRVIARFHLGPLDDKETAHYVQHRLNVAGLVGASPFDTAALRQVHRLARGVPRRINLLCDRALLGAYAQGQHQVSRVVVQQAAAEVFDEASSATPHTAAQPGARPWAWAAGSVLGAALVGAAWWVHEQGAGVGTVPASASAPARSHASAASTASVAGQASAPVGTVSGTVAASAPLASPAPQAQAPMRHLHELQGPDAALWRSLAARWDAPAEVAGPSCTAWPNLGVACYRSSSASLALVRQLNRPVLLTLQQAGTKPPTAQSVPPQPSATAGTPRQVLLVGLDDTTAWLAQPANADAAGDPLVRVPLTELAAVWRGELQTLWRTPPGWRGTTGHGDSPVVQEWISQQLDGLLAPAGAATPAPGANSAPPRPLEDRLRAFQATQGLQPDGLIGPITLMQLNHASGVTEPHLHAGR